MTTPTESSELTLEERLAELESQQSARSVTCHRQSGYLHDLQRMPTSMIVVASEPSKTAGAGAVPIAKRCARCGQLLWTKDGG
jgi:hypothetical protein